MKCNFKAFVKRSKTLLAATILSAIGLYDVITAGGIDLTGILRPLIGDRVDVGRLLSTVALGVTIARFVMTSKIFQTANKNGLDDPDEAAK